jgi:hypothetical protein
MVAIILVIVKSRSTLQKQIYIGFENEPETA